MQVMNQQIMKMFIIKMDKIIRLILIVGFAAAFNETEKSNVSQSQNSTAIPNWILDPLEATTCPRCYTPECKASSPTRPSCQTPDVEISDGEGATRFSAIVNNVPCHPMDGEDVYVVCPTPYTETYSIKVPILCDAGKYWTSRGGCLPFTSSDEIQPHFTDAGVMGRPANKNSHWSATNPPQEGVAYDPLPAECADEAPGTCNGKYKGTERFSVPDVQRLVNDGYTILYNDGTRVPLELDAYNAHVQPIDGTPKTASIGGYHYHASPGWDDGSYADYVIGYALDGVPFMGKGTRLSNGSSSASSYKLKSGHDGRYCMDYEYEEGHGSLDYLNGGMVTIDGEDTYAYFATDDYPYLFRNFRSEFGAMVAAMLLALLV